MHTRIVALIAVMMLAAAARAQNVLITYTDGQLEAPAIATLAGQGVKRAWMITSVDANDDGAADWALIKPQLAGVPSGGMAIYDWEGKAAKALQGPSAAWKPQVALVKSLAAKANAFRPSVKDGLYGYPTGGNNGNAGELSDRIVAGMQHEFTQDFDLVAQSCYLPGPGDYSDYGRHITSEAIDIADPGQKVVAIVWSRYADLTPIPPANLHAWVTLVKNTRGVRNPTRGVDAVIVWTDGEEHFVSASTYDPNAPGLNADQRQVRIQSKAIYGDAFCAAGPTSGPDVARVHAFCQAQALATVQIVLAAVKGEPVPPLPPLPPSTQPIPPPDPPTTAPVPPVPPIPPVDPPSGATLPWAVLPPVAPVQGLTVTSDHGIRLGGLNDRRTVDAVIPATAYHGILLEAQPCHRIEIVGIKALGMPAYGAWFDQGSDVRVVSGQFTQKAGANQAMMRHHGVQHLLYQSCVFDNSIAVNDLARHADGCTVAYQDCLFMGGRINHGWPAGIPGGTSGGAETWYIGCTFEYSPGAGSPGYPQMLNIYAGAKAHFWSCTWRRHDGTTRPLAISDVDGDKAAADFKP